MKKSLLVGSLLGIVALVVMGSTVQAQGDTKATGETARTNHHRLCTVDDHQGSCYYDATEQSVQKQNRGDEQSAATSHGCPWYRRLVGQHRDGCTWAADHDASARGGCC